MKFKKKKNQQQKQGHVQTFIFPEVGYFVMRSDRLHGR